MKASAVLLAIIVLFVGGAAYAGQFGPVDPAAKEGQFSVGIGAMHKQAKWEPNDDDFFEDSKVKQNQIYIQAGYGVVKNLEIYARLGLADLKINDAFLVDDFDDGLKPFGTLGVKGVFPLTKAISIAPFAQASIYSNYSDDMTATDTLPAPLEVGGVIFPAGTYTVDVRGKVERPWEIDLGAALQAKVGDAIIYGGPVLYWSNAEFKADVTLTGPVSGAGSVSSDAEEKSNIGGFAGFRLPLAKGIAVEVEGQLKSKFSIAGAVLFSF